MKSIQRILLVIGLTCLALGARAQALNANITGAQAKSQKFLSVTLATGTAVNATNGATPFTSATFYGYASISMAGAPVANTNTTYVGFSDTGHTVTNMVDSIAAGSWLSIKAPPGTKYDLHDLYFTGTTGEKIKIVYEQ